MALSIPIQLAHTGVTVSYWRITHLQVDCNARIVDAQLHGYLDDTARRDGRAPLHRQSYRVQGDFLPDPFTVAVADIYRAIRKMPEGTDENGTLLPSRFRDALDA
jgi:hypothetical protein